MRILVADDHPLVRKGIRTTLDALSFVDETQAAETHAELLRLAMGADWDLVVMDVDMPEGDALDTLSQLEAHSPELPILVVSVHPEDSYALRILRAGASGYLHKASAVDELEGAIVRIRKGGRYIGAELAEKLFDSADGADEAPHEALSDREMQVLLRLAEGMSVSDIGAELNLSPKTVSTYRARLFEKMGFENVAHVVRYALEHELVE